MAGKATSCQCSNCSNKNVLYIKGKYKCIKCASDKLNKSFSERLHLIDDPSKREYIKTHTKESLKELYDAIVKNYTNDTEEHVIDYFIKSLKDNNCTDKVSLQLLHDIYMNSCQEYIKYENLYMFNTPAILQYLIEEIEKINSFELLL